MYTKNNYWVFLNVNILHNTISSLTKRKQCLLTTGFFFFQTSTLSRTQIGEGIRTGVSPYVVSNTPHVVSPTQSPISTPLSAGESHRLPLGGRKISTFPCFNIHYLHRHPRMITRISTYPQRHPRIHNVTHTPPTHTHTHTRTT